MLQIHKRRGTQLNEIENNSVMIKCTYIVFPPSISILQAYLPLHSLPILPMNTEILPELS